MLNTPQSYEYQVWPGCYHGLSLTPFFDCDARTHTSSIPYTFMYGSNLGNASGSQIRLEFPLVFLWHLICKVHPIHSEACSRYLGRTSWNFVPIKSLIWLRPLEVTLRDWAEAFPHKPQCPRSIHTAYIRQLRKWIFVTPPHHFPCSQPWKARNTVPASQVK